MVISVNVMDLLMLLPNVCTEALTLSVTVSDGKAHPQGPETGIDINGTAVLM